MRNTKLIKDAIATIRQLRKDKNELIEAFKEIYQAVDGLKSQNIELAKQLEEANKKIYTYNQVVQQAEIAYIQLQQAYNELASKRSKKK